MKTNNGSVKNELKKKGLIAKKLSFLGKHSRIKQLNQKRLRFVQSVYAGHVRGGHSFH